MTKVCPLLVMISYYLYFALCNLLFLSGHLMCRIIRDKINDKTKLTKLNAQFRSNNRWPIISERVCSLHPFFGSILTHCWYSATQSFCLFLLVLTVCKVSLFFAAVIVFAYFIDHKKHSDRFIKRVKSTARTGLHKTFN